jgi:hypothetical protein
MWREWEHEDVDNHVVDDLEAMNSLQTMDFSSSLPPRTCGHKKIIANVDRVLGSRADAFIIDDEPLR